MPPSRLQPKTERLILVAILVLGGLLRVAYWAEFRKQADYASPAVDAGFHDDWARSIADPEWVRPVELVDPEIGERAYLRPPGYPWLLAATYKLSGGSPDAPRGLQILLGLLSVFLLQRLGSRVFSPAVGLVAAGMFALYWPALYFEGELHAVTALLPCLLGATLALERWGRSGARFAVLCAGVLLGLAVLLRPNVLLYLPLIAAWMLWRRGSPKRSLLHVGLLAASVLACLLPVTARNMRVEGVPVLVTSNFGINLHIGNNPEADGFVSGELEGLGVFRTCYDYPALVRALEQQEGRSMTSAEVSSLFARRAMRYMVAHPLRTLGLMAKKTALFFGPSEVSHNKVLALDRQRSDVLRFLPSPFALLLALACAGAWSEWRRSRGAERSARSLISLGVLACWLAVVPFFVATRYRMPAVPFLMLFAAAGIVSFVERRRAGQSVGALLSILAVVLLAGLASPIRQQPNAHKWHIDRGRAHARLGQHELALREFGFASKADPERAESLFSAAMSRMAMGKVPEAQLLFQQTLERDPDHLGALNNLGTLEARAGNMSGAAAFFARASAVRPTDPMVLYQWGLSLEGAGESREALARWFQAAETGATPEALFGKLFDAVLRLGGALRGVELAGRWMRETPQSSRARRQLAWLLATSTDSSVRDGQEAERLAREGLSLVPEPTPGLLASLAAALAEQGAFPQAIEAQEQAIELARSRGMAGPLQAFQGNLSELRRSRALRSRP